MTSKRPCWFFLLPLLICSSLVGLPCDPCSSLPTQLIQMKTLFFLTDSESPSLQPGERAVFPYTDEALIMEKLAQGVKEKREKPFSLVIDSFCGDGKSGFPLLDEEIAERLNGSDSNPRAIQYAKANAKLNYLDTKSCFCVRDIETEGLMASNASGNTLWIANPPFALKVKGAVLDKVRDGGENGLRLTTLFATLAMQAAKPGDVIIGIGYSRIASDGKVEMEEMLQQLVKEKGGKLTFSLLKGHKLWRGFNGKKEQENPMPLSPEILALKANPTHNEEKEAYKQAAKFHADQGYTHLGYYSYIIEK